MSKSIRDVVHSYYEAWTSGDSSKFLLSKDFTFNGPLASFTEPQGVVQMAEEIFPMAEGVKILEEMYEGNKALVMLEFSTNTKLGSWLSTDYFEVEKGKIKYGRTFYDPRQLEAFMQEQQAASTTS